MRQLHAAGRRPARVGAAVLGEQRGHCVQGTGSEREERREVHCPFGLQDAEDEERTIWRFPYRQKTSHNGKRAEEGNAGDAEVAGRIILQEEVLVFAAAVLLQLARRVRLPGTHRQEHD